MKRLLATVFSIFIFKLIFGQSLHVFQDQTDVTNKVITVKIAQGSTGAIELSLLNTSDKAIDYQVNRTILNPPMNDSCASLYYCSGTACYVPNSSVIWTPITSPITILVHGIMPDEYGTYGISAHYDVCPTICNDLYVYYRVYNTEANTIDTAHVTIKYTCSNGINEQSKMKGYLSDPYPNPANENFSLNYQLNASSTGKIEISDVIGRKIKELTISEKEAT